jgi:hypothetical protein
LQARRLAFDDVALSQGHCHELRDTDELERLSSNLRGLCRPRPRLAFSRPTQCKRPWLFCRNTGCQCLSWVKRFVQTVCQPLLIYPDQRTSPDRPGCPFRATRRLTDTSSYRITRPARRRTSGGMVRPRRRAVRMSTTRSGQRRVSIGNSVAASPSRSRLACHAMR